MHGIPPSLRRDGAFPIRKRRNMSDRTPPRGSVLRGRHVHLEPLEGHHVAGLVAAALAEPALYRWTMVPQSEDAMREYVRRAVAEQREGSALAFATIDARSGEIVGSTRYFNIERWAWPMGHERFSVATPDACEIGYTWLTRSAIRTAANTEAKLLMLEHAFETWRLLRVCFHTDVRNERSRRAIERIGGELEGILRAHRLASDYSARNSARYSILAEDWPAIKARLEDRLGSA